MCPNSGNFKRDMKRWPKIAEAYRRACRRAYDPEICYSWKSGDDMFEWWISGKGFGNEDQTVMFE